MRKPCPLAPEPELDENDIGLTELPIEAEAKAPAKALGGSDTGLLEAMLTEPKLDGA